MKFSTLTHSKKSLYRELILALIGLVSLVIIIVNVTGYRYLSYQAQHLYQQKTQTYHTYLQTALQIPLKNQDTQAVRQIADAFAANLEVAWLIVRDKQNHEIYHKTKSYQHLLTSRITIEDNRTKTGSIELGLSLDAYQQHNQQLLTGSTITLILMMIMLLLALRWLLGRILKKPISALVHATGNIAAKKYLHKADFSLDYKEFSPISSGFHGMSEAIAHREDALEQINQRLATEIEERKQAEQALQLKTAEMTQFFNVSLDLLCITDLQGGFLRLNPVWEQTLGFTTTELLNHRFFDFIHPDDLETTQAALKTLLEQKKVCCFVNRYGGKDGDYRWLEWRSARADSLIYAAARDITEHICTEEQLRDYKEHLEEQVEERTAELRLSRDAAEAANKAKSLFLANMSHELRTPLNAILGFSSIMHKDPQLTDTQRENLDIINRSGTHLLTLINDVLEMAKIEAGKTQLENKPFDLGNLVRDVIDMMHIRASDKNLQLLLDQASSFPRYIKGDEARVRQILVNLVGNAIKFTKQGGVTVRLGTKSGEINSLLIEIEDSGIGISPENLQQIFKPFVQVGDRSFEQQQGTGLGLTITQQFVQMMGGTIQVESTVGKGTLFRVELPLQQAEAAELNLAVSEQVNVGEVISLAVGQPRYKILIAEDQPENRLLLIKLMEILGLPLRIVENGEQCVDVFQSWQPDLIWMDRRMPVMDGIEATQKIRQLPHGKDVKIIAVTASAFSEQRAEMLAAGLDDFVRKPYRATEIYDCLSKHLHLKYRYADTTGKPEMETVLTPEMFASLASDLTEELHQAVESLDNEQIEAVLVKVAEYQPTLSKILSQLANNYDYPTILAALEKAV